MQSASAGETLAKFKLVDEQHPDHRELVLEAPPLCFVAGIEELMDQAQLEH